MRNSPNRCVRRLLVALPLSLVVSCGAVNASAGPDAAPEPVAPAAPEATPSPTPQASATAPATPPPRTPLPEPPKRIDPAVVERAAAGVEPNTIVGAVVVDRVANSVPLAVNIERQFRSASLVKLLIVIDALERGADATDRRRLATMLRLSDDDLASAYWVSGGYSDIVLRTSVAIELQGTQPPEQPGKWGEVRLTPADVARIYDYILRMPAADRDLIVRALAKAPRVAADGFDQHFGIPAGLRSPWAIKQGWGNNSQAMVLHSTGLAGPDWRYIVVLLTEHPLGSGWSTSAESVSAVAEALRGKLPGA